MAKIPGVRDLALTAAAAVAIGMLATASASAQAVNQYAYHDGYSDHDWGWNGYYDGYVGSYGAYNDSPLWRRGYYPADGYYPDYYSYYPGYGYYYPGGYVYDGYPGPGVGVDLGPVGFEVW